MRVLVTGVTGFIGGFLAESLVKSGYEVAGFARMTSNTQVSQGISLYRGSLTDRESVRWAVKDFQPEVVCHLGAITPVAYSFDHPGEVIETNLLGTVNLSEACMREAPSLRRFLFASSMEVYGDQSGSLGPYDEETPTRPSCPYAVAKLACEKYLDYLGRHHDFPWVALRQTNAYGRNHDSRFVIEGLLRQMLAGGEVVAGDPKPYRNFMHVEDLVSLYLRLVSMDFDRVKGTFYTVGPDCPISIKDLSKKLAALTGWEGSIKWNTLPKRPGEIFYLNSSNRKISSRTGWHPEISLQKGLEGVVEAWRRRTPVTVPLP